MGVIRCCIGSLCALHWHASVVTCTVTHIACRSDSEKPSEPSLRRKATPSASSHATMRRTNAEVIERSVTASTQFQIDER